MYSNSYQKCVRAVQQHHRQKNAKKWNEGRRKLARPLWKFVAEPVFFSSRTASVGAVMLSCGFALKPAQSEQIIVKPQTERRYYLEGEPKSQKRLENRAKEKSTDMERRRSCFPT